MKDTHLHKDEIERNTIANVVRSILEVALNIQYATSYDGSPKLLLIRNDHLRYIAVVDRLECTHLGTAILGYNPSTS